MSTENIPSGYKQTEIGVIPKDWEVKTANQVGTPVRGGSPRPAGDLRYFNGSYIPWLTVAALTNIPASQLIVSETMTFLTEEGSLHSRILIPGTLIIANSGATLGVAKILGIKCCANDGIAALLNLSKNVSPHYLAHFINTKTSYLREVVATGNGQPNLNTELIGNFKIPLPPTKAEQEAIAKALSDVDSLIESLEQLIVKKRQIKQGAMQELLTGKRRLLGFETKKGYKHAEVGIIPEDWRTPTLGSLTVLMTNGFVGTATTHYASNDNGILYIQGYNVEENSFNFHGIKFVTESFHSAHMKSCLRGGDLLIVQTGDSGLTSIVPESLAGSNCHALIISRFDQKQIFPAFISYYLNSKPGRSRLKFIETGTTMKHLNVGDMLQFIVPLPPTKAEQEAIANILLDIDSEITVLNEKLAKARQIKQGMMQELLTGRIRLV